MTQIPATDVARLSEVAHELEEIGEEFGCSRDGSETIDEYGIRIVAYLDEMIEELRQTQDSVDLPCFFGPFLT